MAKLKNPFLGFDVRGSLAKVISFRSPPGQHIVENRPLPADPKSPAQLHWRTLYQQAVALWHALSAAEKITWEAQGTARHMTGFAWFMSQCLRPNPGIYLPLLGGTMQGDIDTNTHKITGLPTPAADTHAATKKYVDDATPPTPSKIIDADGDTKVDVEESADEDKVRMDVKGVESFLLHDDGILDLVKQSAARAYLDSAQNIPHNTWTKVLLDAEDFDVQGEFDPTVNYRFTAKKAGYYVAAGCVGYDSPTTAHYWSAIYKNGGVELMVYNGGTMVAGGVHMGFILGVVHLAATQYLELWAFQNTGGAVALMEHRTQTFMSVHKLS